MTPTQVYKKLSTIKFVPNKDCSEYAEDVKSILGNRGTIFDIRALNAGDKEVFFKTPYNEMCQYHTVVRLVLDKQVYIIDMLSKGTIFTLDYYMSILASYNKDNANIARFTVTKSTVVK